MTTLESFNTSIGDAITEIQAIMTEISTGGNVDGEINALNEIIKKLTLGDLTAGEAVREAHALQDARMER